MTTPNHEPQPTADEIADLSGAETMPDDAILEQRRLEAGEQLRDFIRTSEIAEGVAALRQDEEDGTSEARDAFADKMKKRGLYE